MKKKYLLPILFLIWGCEEKRQTNLTTVTRGSVKAEIILSGRLRSSDRRLVNSPVDGVIHRVYVTDGGFVKAGDPLVEIKLGEEKFDRLRNQNQELEKLIISKQSRLSYLNSQKKELGHLNTLFQARTIASNQVEAKKQDIQQILADIKQIDVSIESTKTAISSQKSLQPITVVRAPLSGIVQNLWFFEEQNPVNTNIGKDAYLLAIESNDASSLKINVREQDIGHLRNGMNVGLHLFSDPTKKYPARIESVGARPIVNPNTGVAEYKANLKLMRDDPRLIGMEFVATIPIQAKSNVLSIPRSAYSFEEGRYWVQGIVKNVISKRQITLGLVGDESVEVLSGLTEGETIRAIYEN